MKKINFLLGILITSLVLLLTLRPVNAQAEQLMGYVSDDYLSIVITSVLAPIWFIVGKKANQLLR